MRLSNRVFPDFKDDLFPIPNLLNGDFLSEIFRKI